MAAEEMLSYPTPMMRVTGVRSTLIHASLDSLRQRNLVDRYRAILPAQYHRALLETLAPTWLSIQEGMAHYDTCERLQLDEHTQADIGGDVGRRIQASALSTIARAGRAAAGMTPWLALAAVDRMWARLMQGGGVRVLKVGPKDAMIEFEAVPLAQFLYFRNAFRGLILAAAELLSPRAFVHTQHQKCGPLKLSYRVSWV